jgi:replicative DNA helicase
MLWGHKVKNIVDVIRKKQIESAVRSINFGGSVQDVLEQVSALSKFSANRKGFFCDLDKEIKAIIEGRAVRRISTGVPDLDAFLGGGFALGDVSVVAGATGSGKSAFALNVAYHVLKHQIASVTIYSLEMTASTNLRRLAAIHSGVSAGAVGKCEASRKALEAFGRAYRDGLLKIRGASTGLAEMRSQAVIDGKWSDKPNLTIVDYTGLIQHKGKSSYERMSEISRELRQIALDSGSALLEVVQLNREYKKQMDSNSAEDTRPPILSDLRDSGQIEQDATVILMIHSLKDSFQNGWSTKEIWIRKNRDGEVDEHIEMDFHGPTFRFKEVIE